MVNEVKSPLYCPRTSLFLQSESTAPNGPGWWYARVPTEHTLDDVMNPAYFGREIATEKTQKAIRTGDFIQIEPENSVWWMHVRVMAIKPAVAQALIRQLDFKDFQVTPPSGFRFVWAGNTGLWQVWKGKVLIDGGFQSQEECLDFANEKRRERTV